MPKTDFLVPLPLFSGREEICPETIIVIGGRGPRPQGGQPPETVDPTANVTMIDENINISFGGCGIPYYVSGEINSLDALRSTTYGTVRTPSISSIRACIP